MIKYSMHQIYRIIFALINNYLQTGVSICLTFFLGDSHFFLSIIWFLVNISQLQHSQVCYFLYKSLHPTVKEYVCLLFVNYSIITVAVYI